MEEDNDDAIFIAPEDIAEEFPIGDTSAADSDDDAGAAGDDDDMDREDAMETEGGEAAAPDDMAIATFDGHSDSVYCVAVNPRNPAQLVTGGGDDRGFLWSLDAAGEASGGRLGLGSVRELGGHADSVSSVGFSADGTLAATGAFDGRVSVWDAASGALKATLEGPEDVEWLCWHGKGNIVLAGSGDATVWMWMAANGTCMQVFAGHEGKVTCGTFTTSGKAVVTGSSDCSVRVWAPKTGECRHAFAGHGCHEAPVTCLATHPDLEQPHVVMSGSEDGTAKLLHLHSKKVLQTFVHSGSADEGTAAGAGGQEEVYSVEAVGLAASHPWAATGGLDGVLKVWDVVAGRERQSCKHPGGGGVTKLQWHPTAPLIFTSCADGALRLWDARTGQVARQYTGHADMVLDFALCPAVPAPLPSEPPAPAAPPRWLVSVSDDHTARVFDIGAF